MDRTELAAAEIVGGTVLVAWLVKPDNGPERVVIMWPEKPTAVSPRRYSEVIAQITRVLANSSIEFSRHASKRRQVITNSHDSAQLLVRITKIKSATPSRWRPS